jgi:hypothetical protein
MSIAFAPSRTAVRNHVKREAARKALAGLHDASEDAWTDVAQAVEALNNPDAWKVICEWVAKRVRDKTARAAAPKAIWAERKRLRQERRAERTGFLTILRD